MYLKLFQGIFDVLEDPFWGSYNRLSKTVYFFIFFFFLTQAFGIICLYRLQGEMVYTKIA